ncbi:hypothetical protein BH09ACT6_BH09ACT6_13630 [soil metagenome]
MKSLTTARLTVVAALVLLALTGCSTGSATAPSSTPAESEASSLSIQDAWVKAADSGMSAVFGTLVNAGGTPITVVSATSPSSRTLQLHETIQNSAGEMVMQAKAGGFVIPAGGSFELAPGGNHIMLMGLTAPVKAGDEATFTLTLSDGSPYVFTAPAKDYTGAGEKYVSSGGMDMSATPAE